MKEAISISQFRSSLKESFDLALKGDPVVIERGGVRYTLVCEVVAFQVPRGASAATAIKVDKVLKGQKILPMSGMATGGVIYNLDASKGTNTTSFVPDKTLEFNERRTANGVCKVHGLPLDDRGKCLQKGCKYA